MKQLNLYIIEKLHLNKDIKISPIEQSRIDKIVLDIVSTYFGGLIPDFLEDEGEEFNSDKEKYELIEKMETYYINHADPNKSEFNESDIDIIHLQLEKWLDKHNKNVKK